MCTNLPPSCSFQATQQVRTQANLDLSVSFMFHNVGWNTEGFLFPVILLCSCGGWVSQHFTKHVQVCLLMRAFLQFLSPSVWGTFKKSKKRFLLFKKAILLHTISTACWDFTTPNYTVDLWKCLVILIVTFLVVIVFHILQYLYSKL